MAYIGKQPVVGNFVKLDAITTSATTTFNLTNGGVAYFPQTANNCIVSLNGVIQSPTSAYTISGSTIVFSDALTSSDTIDFILVLGDVLSIGTPSDGTITSAKLASGVSGLISWQSVQTSGFTAVAGRGYPCNTTSAAFTVTLPASPSAGDEVIILDYAGTFDTNALTISPNGNKIEGGTSNLQLTGDREGVRLVYIDATQGWLSYSGINEGTDALSPVPYSIDFLVIAGGGGGGAQTGGGAGAGGYRTSTQTVSAGTVITVTVGDGGAGAVNTGSPTSNGSNGSNSSISGSGLTTITSAGGGGGASYNGNNGSSGGSGGGGGYQNGIGGAGNTPSTSPSQGNSGGDNGGSGNGSGGGGGAGAVGQTVTAGSAGGNGTASSITGSSVTRAGGGGGWNSSSATPPSGGTGGGGTGSGSGNATGGNGTANTGGGGGGGRNENGGSGGKGVVILSLPTASYSSTTTGSPTVTTSGSNTILTFNGSGSYTA